MNNRHRVERAVLALAQVHVSSVLDDGTPLTVCVETFTLHAEEVSHLREPEAILLDLQDTFAERLRRGLLVDLKVHMNVDEVFDRVFPRKLPVLVHLPDEDTHCVVALAVLGEHPRDANGSHGVRSPVAIETVVVGLQGVADKEKRLVRALLAQVICVVEHVGNETIFTNDESALQVEALGGFANLERVLFLTIQEGDTACPGPSVCELLRERRFARASAAGEKNRSRRSRAELLLTCAEQLIDEIETGGHPNLETRIEVQAQNVGAFSGNHRREFEHCRILRVLVFAHSCFLRCETTLYPGSHTFTLLQALPSRVKEHAHEDQKLHQGV